jgi:hypothetical protein
MNEKLVNLATSLTAATQRGQIQWEATLSDVFRASVGSGYVTVSEGNEVSYGESYTFISMRITDQKGRLVESVFFNEGGVSHDVGVKLLVAARRSALNSNAIVDEMLEAIGGR